jgi:hypothetical protein
LYNTLVLVKSHAFFHGYDKAWFLSDVTDVKRLEAFKYITHQGWVKASGAADPGSRVPGAKKWAQNSLKKKKYALNKF